MRIAERVSDLVARRGVSIRELKLLGGILLVGVLLRGCYLVEISQAPDFSSPGMDGAYHDHWARGLAFDDWSLSPEYPDPQIRTTPYFRPPGYPHFLALIHALSGPSYAVPRIVQLVLGLASGVLAYVLARRLFGASVGLLTALFMSLYWAFIYFEGELLAPGLLVLLTLLLLNVVVRWSDEPTWLRVVGGGVLLGLFALVRPNILLFIPAVLVWSWWVARRREAGRRWWLTSAGFLAGAAVAIAPATLRNYIVAGEFVLISTNGGINLYIGNNETTDCVSAGVPGLKPLIGRGGWTSFDHVHIVESVRRIEGRAMTHSEVSAYFAKKAVDFGKTNPMQVLKLAAKKALLFWGPAEVSNNKVIQDDRAHSRVLRWSPSFPVVVALFLVGLVLFWSDLPGNKLEGVCSGRDRRQVAEGATLLLLFVVVYFGSFLPFFFAGRYRVPIIPVLLLFAAYGICRVVRSLKERNYLRSPALFVVLVPALYILASQPFVPYEPDHAWRYLLRGEAAERLGNHRVAAQEYGTALQESPVNPIIHYKLGQQLTQLGRHREAIANFLQAVEVEPRFAEAHLAAGIAYGMLDDPESAAKQYQAAVGIRPQMLSAQYNLAMVLAHLERYGEAVEALETALELADKAGQAELVARISARLEQLRKLQLSPES